MEKTCESCKHFRQHYIKFGYRYNKVPSGHCVYPGRKLRRSETPACPHYKGKPGS